MESTNTPTPADRLRARLKAAAKADSTAPLRTWDPRHDDPPTLIGEVVSTATVVTRYGPSLVATLRDEDNESWACWITSATMKSEWEREDPQPGECVMVHYGGEKETHDGKRHYPVFSVFTDRPDDPPAEGNARFGPVPF